jgi:hypothetical protein
VSLDERILGRLLRVGLVSGHEVSGSECDCLVCAHELFVSRRVASLRTRDELRFGKWPAHHRRKYTES